LIFLRIADGHGYNDRVQFRFGGCLYYPLLYQLGLIRIRPRQQNGEFISAHASNNLIGPAAFLNISATAVSNRSPISWPKASFVSFSPLTSSVITVNGKLLGIFQFFVGFVQIPAIEQSGQMIVIAQKLDCFCLSLYSEKFLKTMTTPRDVAGIFFIGAAMICIGISSPDFDTRSVGKYG
jgi:hypothetical protein